MRPHCRQVVMKPRRRMPLQNPGDGILAVKTVASIGTETGIESILVVCSPMSQLKGANTGRLLVHSMTLSAIATSAGGTESPSCLAVLILMDNSNLVTW